MKKSVFITLAFVCLLISSSVLAKSTPWGPKEKRFGLGIVLGEPTGITAKGYLTKALAIDVVGAWSFVNNGATILGDATYDFFDLPVDSDVITVPFYAGAGAKVVINGNQQHRSDRSSFGVRIPVGLAIQWQKYPVELYLEVGPGIELAPETEADISGGLGARYYF